MTDEVTPKTTPVLTHGGREVLVVPARYFTVAHRKKVDWLVLHTAEVDGRPGMARQVARYFNAMLDGRKASAHYVVDGSDQDSIARCVPEEHVAWHAPGANSRGIGIEFCARAAWTADDWWTPYAERMLLAAAELSAQVAKRWELPLEAVDAQGLAAGRRGITTHAAVTAAFNRSTHTDPGPAFPLDRFMELVRNASPKEE